MATHAGGLNSSGRIKSVKNLEQSGWWLAHTDNRTPPTWVDAKLNPGEIKTAPWAGMGVAEVQGNYTGADPISHFP